MSRAQGNEGRRAGQAAKIATSLALRAFARRFDRRRRAA
jgi:hypothetical protein